MNPQTNRFETLTPGPDRDLLRVAAGGPLQASVGLLRPNGEPVPPHWTQFQVGECVVIKNYTFKVAYIGETAILIGEVARLKGELAEARGKEVTP
jgi:hypothetical protein